MQFKRNLMTTAFYNQYVSSMLIVMNNRAFSVDQVFPAPAVSGLPGQTLRDLVSANPTRNGALQFGPTDVKSMAGKVAQVKSKGGAGVPVKSKVGASKLWDLASHHEDAHVCQRLAFNTMDDKRYDSTAMRIGTTLATRDKKQSDGDDDNMYAGACAS